MQAALPNHRRKRTQLDRKYTTHVVQQHPKFQTEKDTTRFSHQPGHDTRLHIYRDSLEVNADGHTQSLQGYGSMDLWQVRYIHFYLYACCTFYFTKVMEIYNSMRAELETSALECAKLQLPFSDITDSHMSAIPITN